MGQVLSFELIPPILALAAWTLVMLVWLYAVRIPAIREQKIDVQATAGQGKRIELPPEVTRVADNYNHLTEQPTVFYAVALAGQYAGPGVVTVWLAWAYVLIRILHSFVQATVNHIHTRFAVFVVSSLVLGGLIVSVVCDLFGHAFPG